MRRNLLFKPWMVAVIALFISSPSYAIGGISPADTQVLSQMYAALKEQLEALKEQLEEVKVASDQAFKAREYLNAVRDEYRFVKSFDPQREINSLVGWADGMTNLNDLEGQNWQQRWYLLSDEIDKRFEQSDAPKAVKETVRDISLRDFSELGQLDQLQEFYRQQALSTESATTKDLQRQTASSTAMMTSIMLEQRAERLAEKAAAHQAAMNRLEWENSFMRHLSGDL